MSNIVCTIICHCVLGLYLASPFRGLTIRIIGLYWMIVRRCKVSVNRTSWTYKRRVSLWGEIYRKMKFEIETGYFTDTTIWDSYRIATTDRARRWLFKKWQTAILSHFDRMPDLCIRMLETNSQRALRKVTHRHWWEAQMNGTPCLCYRCAATGATLHLNPRDYCQGSMDYDRSQALETAIPVNW